jgi:integrase
MLSLKITLEMSGKSYKLRMLAPSMKEVSEIELNRKSQRIDRPDGERPMTLDDFYEIFDASAPHVQIYLMLATLCGARKGAILDLTWDRVSLNPDDPY